MKLKEHYSINSRKSIKPFFKLILLFFVCITISHTFARYAYTTSNNGVISIAKWNIEVNGVEINNTTNNLNTSINLLNVADNSTNIDSGDECYFDIILNPKNTEVSISYSIIIDLDESNLPDGTKILKYEKYTNTGELEKFENINGKTVNISEHIALSEEKTALDDISARKYRFYCKLPFPADIDKNQELVVRPKIEVEQYIN